MNNNIDFYAEALESSFRFGDVLQGFVTTTPYLISPIKKNYNYSIDVSSQYCIIVSPCCSISDAVLSLAPLIRVKKSFFSNPYFEEDLTRINRIVHPENSLPPIAWETMKPEVKSEKLAADPGYAFYDLFIYDKNIIFAEYEVNLRDRDNIKTRCYMIDFRNIFSVNCPKIKKPENVPIESKVLQLSDVSRSELRDKILFYFGRVNSGLD